jgi:hypothetical protein
MNSMTIFCDRCGQEVKGGAVPAVSDVDYRRLPSVSVWEFRSLPRSGGVYFAYSATRLCYIGKARDLYVRWSQHPQLSRLFREPDGRIAWITIHDKADRWRFERHAIDYFKPEWNANGSDFLKHFQVSKRFPPVLGCKTKRLEIIESLRRSLG